MPVVVAGLLQRSPALAALRKELPPVGIKVLAARSPSHLASILSSQLIDSVVLGAESMVRSPAFDSLRADYPTLPVSLYAPIRSDDAGLVRRARRRGAAGVFVEGLDEPVLGRSILALGMTSRRQAALLELAPALDLVDDIQLQAWKLIIVQAPSGLATEKLAKQLKVSRENLARRFSAGQAPTLKTAIDMVRLVSAGQLLGSPAWGVGDAARLLGYSSPSLLQRSARRLVGTSAATLGSLPPDRIMAKLLKSRVVRWS